MKESAIAHAALLMHEKSLEIHQLLEARYPGRVETHGDSTYLNAPLTQAEADALFDEITSTWNAGAPKP